jgi:hypothetical protein
MYQHIKFPTHLIDTDIEETINKHELFLSTFYGISSAVSTDEHKNQGDNLERLLIEKKVPFDRHSTGPMFESFPEIRYFRPSL